MKKNRFGLIRKLILFFIVFSLTLTSWEPLLLDVSRPVVGQALAASQETLYAGTGANFNDLGLTAWSNPANIQGDTTNTAATVNILLNGGTSQRLRASNFGFSIPSNATINGVTVEVEQSASNNNRHYWNSVRLLVAGSESGNDNSDGSPITGKALKQFGSTTDLWGTSLSPSVINASGFGVSLKLSRNHVQSTTTSIYRVRISVDYSITSVPVVTTQAASDIAATTATANGNIIATGGENADMRGFVYDTVSRSLPGNVAPGSSGYANFAQDTGSFGAGAFTKSLTGLTSGNTYYVRSFAHNSAGYSYGDEISFTSVVISVVISTDGSISYGTLNSGESRSTIQLSDTQTAKNDGNVAEDLNIKTSAPSGWSLGSSASTDIFVHEFSVDSGNNWTKLTTADSYQSLTTNIAANGTQDVDLRLTAPDPSTSTSLKTITITIQAVQH